MSFKNKVVLVTGAGSGIGAATAVLFAKEGADVAMVDKNEEKLDAVADKVATIGNKPCVIYADVSKDADVQRIVKETIANFGKLDVLINNAGFVNSGTILDGKIVEAYDAIMKVNVRAAIHLTTLAAPHLAATKGNIVNTSSAASMYVPVNSAINAYAISKAALDHFTRGAALELAASGVRVNSVNPGPVDTDLIKNAGVATKIGNHSNHAQLTAFKRTLDPEEIADLIVYLASDKARGITGSNFVIDNGLLLKTK
ncbi:enoyl-(Acyl carrier protein) reductase domain-containing protein [Phthorimaea operculella]|nr:enoyl-(Acyl carrier protein) reductase domain-containing protein [Phthorimaea operculella]